MGGAAVTGDGEHRLYSAAVDIFGNEGEVVASETFRLDATLPVITCPEAGPFLLHSGEHAVGPEGVDASVSGLDEAASHLSGTLSTDSLGAKPVTFTAQDLAGNLASVACNYRVIYAFGGFYPPLAAAPALNPAVNGRSIPLKFSLAGNQGLDVLAAGYPTSQQVDCATRAPIDAAIKASPPGRSGLSYDPVTGWYSYVWKTDKTKAGSCRVVTIQLVDGTEHLAAFRFR